MVVGEDGNIAPAVIGGGKKLYTGPISDLISYNGSTFIIAKDFDIEYIGYISNIYHSTTFTAHKGTLTNLNGKNVSICEGHAISTSSRDSITIRSDNKIFVYVNGNSAIQVTAENYDWRSGGDYLYKLYV